MLVYVLIFFALFLFSFTGKYRKFFFYTSVVFLVIFGGFRAHYIGVNTKGGYQAIYNSILRYSKTYDIEKLWVVLNNLAIRLGWGYTGVIFMAECLCVLPAAYVMKKSKVNEMLSLSIYYGMYLYLHSFNMIRQCIAMSFCLLAFYFFLKKKRFLFCAYFLVAFFFHKSALIFLLVPLSAKMRISFNKALFFCIASFLMGLVFTNKIFMFLAGPYAGYLKGSSFGFREQSVVRILFASLIDIFFLLYLFLLGRKNRGIYGGGYFNGRTAFFWEFAA